MKPFALFAPPAGSCLRLDHDEQGRPRVSWPLPTTGGFNHWSDIGCSAVLVLFMSGLLLSALAGLLSDRPEQAIGSLCCSAIIFLPILGLLPRVILSFRPPLPASLTFGQYKLFYDPGRSRTYREKGMLADWTALLAGGPRGRPISLSRPDQMRLDRLGARQRLSIDVGAERVEVGSSLTEPEREWLAKNLTAWLAQIPDVLPG